MERAIGKSITSLFAAGPRGLVQQLDINVTAAALQNGIVNDNDKAVEIEQTYDIIQEFCFLNVIWPSALQAALKIHIISI